MSKLSYLVTMTINDGQLDEFKRQADVFIKGVEENEPDTLGYTWWISEDGKACHIHESFASSEAMLVHLGNVGPTLPTLLEIAPITKITVFGDPSADAREALAGFPHEICPMHGGVTR
ncbi:hypothetical protein OAU50_03765 [Planctomycetota bacterium]|nr:hypothetical protein [Planctomycetota bacterium]